MKDKKINHITLIILLVGIIISSVLLFGKFAYSFLGADITEDVWNEGEVTATGDILMFTKGDNLTISATTDNFNLSSGNLSSTTNPKAKLIANNKTNEATASYSTGIKIKKNTYKYTTTDNKPELILTVQDENGNNITSATDLTYVTNINGVSGFDITTKKGTISIANDQSISTTSSTTGTTHTWTYTLTFINYQTDQSLNENASIEIDILFNSNNIINTKVLSDYIISTYQTDDTLYLHNSSLENGANDNSYRYSGSHDAVKNFVCFGSNEETCPNDNLYRIIGVFGDKVKLIKYDFATKEQLGIGRAYYTEFSPIAENYKGSLSEIDTYYWNLTGTINWNESELNTIHLNETYLNNLGSTWTDKIATTTWNVGGVSLANGMESNAKTAYDYEVGTKKIDKTYEAKIGLMYLSEYYYSALPTHWTKPGYNSDSSKDYSSAINDNWMYMGGFEDWTITPSTDYDPDPNVDPGLPEGPATDPDPVLAPLSVGDTYYAFTVYDSVYYKPVYEIIASMHWGVRPSFSLASSVELASGSGTKGEPYRIKI